MSSSSSGIPGEVSVDWADDSASIAPERLFDLKINNRMFEASLAEDPSFPGTMSFAVGKDMVAKSMKGCVVVTYDTDTQVTAAQLEYFGYDPNCASKEPLPPSGSKSMLIGSLLAFRELAPSYVKTLYLNDESNFRCEDHPSVVRTILASLFLTGKSYYQRLLGVAPTEQTFAKLIPVLRKMNEVIPRDGADSFWTKIIEGKKEDRAWLESNRAVIHECLTGKTWRRAVVAIHARLGCMFFACAHDQLADLFGTDGLMGSSWKVDLADIPESCNGNKVDFSVEESVMTGGGRSKYMADVRAAAKAVMRRRAGLSKARLIRKYRRA